MFSYYSVSMHDMDNHNIGYSAAKSKKYPCISGTWRPRVGFGAHVCYHCRIRPPRFLAECRKRRLNQGSFVLLFFRLFTLSDLYLVSVCLFSCTALFVSVSQVIARLAVKTAIEMTYCVLGGALNSTHSLTHFETECVMVVQGHPRSLILAPIESMCATFY